MYQDLHAPHSIKCIFSMTVSVKSEISKSHVIQNVPIYFRKAIGNKREKEDNNKITNMVMGFFLKKKERCFFKKKRSLQTILAKVHV